MKKIFLIVPFLFLVGCTCTMPRTLRIPQPDCQKGLPIFQKYVEKNLLSAKQNVWIVDLDMFYNAELQTCIGKYSAYRKEGEKDDMVLFSIRNIRKNEDIFYAKYIGANLRDEREGQKKYQEIVHVLGGR
ncbi:MAG: hypothetical protein WC753_03780 [Candidatus Gracilibacteria bacterium]